MTKRLLRPFALPLSIGTDIVQISRISGILSNSKSEQSATKFLERLFTRREQLHFSQRFSDVRQALSESTQRDVLTKHIAGRFAAKEAVMKACTWRRLYMHDIQILRRSETPSLYGVILDKTDSLNASSDDRAVLPQESTEIDIDDEPNGQVVQVSISHDGDYATAVCIATVEPNENDVGGEAAARSP